MRHANGNAHGDAHIYAYGDSDGNSHIHSNSDADGNCHVHADRDCDRNVDSDSHSNSNCYGNCECVAAAFTDATASRATATGGTATVTSVRVKKNLQTTVLNNGVYLFRDTGPSPGSLDAGDAKIAQGSFGPGPDINVDLSISEVVDSPIGGSATDVGGVRIRRKTRGAFSAATATRSPPTASTPMAVPRSNGAFTGCPSLPR